MYLVEQQEKDVNLDQKILVLENKVIDFLTMITWWTEVRWSKSNLSIAIVVTTFSTVLGCITLGLIVSDLVVERRGLFFIFIISISLTLETLFLFFLLFFEEKAVTIFKKLFPQGFPNPCRISQKHSKSRRIIFLLALFVYVFLA